MVSMASYDEPRSMASERASLKKRKRDRAMHPQNKYAERAPDFAFLASTYPSFKDFVSYTQNGKARIDWTDFNATRELTRVLLKHDYGIDWWIPDGHLCPTVPNRANYIHWIEDLLMDFPAPWHSTNDDVDDAIWGLDIGTGASCIYPLLGAALHGWNFIGTDITETAIQWAERNLKQNPHLTHLISVRSNKDSTYQDDQPCEKCTGADAHVHESNNMPPDKRGTANEATSSTEGIDDQAQDNTCISHINSSCEGMGSYHKFTKSGRNLPKESLAAEHSCKYEGPPVLLGVVNSTEKFDFCMCNPPFFESIEQAGANPRTACGGTVEEMVCPGGEEGFISRIIEDSTQLKEQIHWFTTMVGRKVSLKGLIPKLRKHGVKVLRTTEFVQGRTSRWGLAWSFRQPHEKPYTGLSTSNKRQFLLEGLVNCKAYDVLQAMAHHIQDLGIACEVDTPKFSIKGCLSSEMRQKGFTEENSLSSNESGFSISVFEQAPGALLIKGMLLGSKSSDAGIFSTLFNSAEQHLKHHFGNQSQVKG